MYHGAVWSDGDRRPADVVVLSGGGHPSADPGALADQVLPEAEIESLMDAAEDWRERFGVSPELVEHAIREAKESWLLGETPDTWSPLGSASDFADFGRWHEGEELAAALAGRQEQGASFVVGDIDADAHVVVSLEVGGERAAAFAYDHHGFVMPFSSSIDDLEITVDEGPAEARVWGSVGAAMPSGDRQTLVLWRVYSGGNSWTRDVVSSARDGVHRLAIRGLEGAGLVVGRALRLANRRLTKVRRDPFMRRRLTRAEALDRKTSTECPKLGDAPSKPASAVVVIHGTMATAMPLAAAVRASVGDGLGQPCMRYEHDTWHALEANAVELAGLITEHVRKSVVLIAHSRGGLVAARAAQLLTASKAVRVAGLLTLGSPFAGTPLALGARAPSLGMTATMGGLRFFGGPVVDYATRIGALILRVDPPPGLTVMNTTNEALPILRQYFPQPAITVAGTADGSADRYGAGVITGVGSGAFGDEPNDLIVSVASALVENAEHIVVESDHFSYCDEPAVNAAMRMSVSRLPPETGTSPEQSEDDLLEW